MASKDLINIAMQLAKQLGANTNKFLGQRTNISFLGKGPKDDLLFQENINEEALSVLPLSKILPQIESSMSYLTGGKLNDIQANKLISNLQKMKEFHFPPAPPANITDLASGTGNLTPGGLEYLRLTGRAGKKVGDEIDLPEGVDPRDTILPTKDIRKVIDEKEGDDFIDFIRSQGDEAGANKVQAEVDRLNAAIAAADARVAGKSSAEIDALETMTKNKAGAEFITGFVDDVYKNSGVTSSVDVAKKRAAAREFLFTMLKKETDLLPRGGTLESVISDADYKYIMEGGGGALGDPLILVKKYFGDTIARRIPLDTRTEVIDAFVDNVRYTKDKAGFETDDIRFNPDDLPDFATGGRVGFRFGSGFKNAKRINQILKKFDITPSQATDMNITIVKKYGDVIDDNLMRQMLYDQDPQNLAEVMATLDEALLMQQRGMNPETIIKSFKDSWGRKKNAHGGLAKILEV
jgi:hypothetical protein